MLSGLQISTGSGIIHREKDYTNIAVLRLLCSLEIVLRPEEKTVFYDISKSKDFRSLRVVSAPTNSTIAVILHPQAPLGTEIDMRDNVRDRAKLYRAFSNFLSAIRIMAVS